MISDRPLAAALTTLIVLQVIMLTSLYAGVPPHPPEATPLFGIGPFIGASVAIAMSALIIGPGQDRAGRALSALACLAALVSFGPQKYFDAQFPMIWPAVLTAQVAIAVIVVRVMGLRARHGTALA